MAADMTYAQALTDAKNLIVQQSNRIKADAERVKSQGHEIAAQKATISELSQEVSDLRPLRQQIADITAAKEHVEAAVGRQRVQIDALEAAANEQQQVIAAQNQKISELEVMVDNLREQLPTDADNSALNGMAALLQSMRVQKKSDSEQIHAAIRQAA